jgi:MSHA biogenesis protein MshM
MYLAHYAFQSMPFALTPNTAFYVELATHQQAMEVLQTALALGEGFIKVTGEVGTGKTLLCRKLMQEAPTEWTIAYVPDPQLTPTQLRWALALELGLKQSANVDELQLAHLLQRWLLHLAQQGQRVILLIDEAQALPDDTLEALRLLSNLETEQHKLVQVVLFAQPELDRRLARYQFRQLRQRISFSCQLGMLTSAQVSNYVNERLQRAGRIEPLFSAPALQLLAWFSRGIPRLINMMAHKTLLLGYGAGLSEIGVRQVMLAAMDTEDVIMPWRQGPLVWLFLAAMVFSIFAISSASFGWQWLTTLSGGLG